MQKIAIFGVPRSGTSWLGQIFNSHPDVAFRFQPLFSYTHKGKLTERSTELEISKFFKEILATEDQFVLMKSDFTKSYPMFQKATHPTNIVFKETRYLNIMDNMLSQSRDLKLIGIVRDPRSVLASWMNAPKEFKTDWKIEKEWYLAKKKNEGRDEEFFGFNKWKQAASDFLDFENRYPDQFFLVKYADLRRDTNLIVRNLFKFCNLGLDKQTSDFIQASKTRHDVDINSVFRANVDNRKWETMIPVDIIDKINAQLRNTPLVQFIEKST